MLEVREIEIALRRLSGGAAHAQLRGNTDLAPCCQRNRSVRTSHSVKPEITSTNHSRNRSTSVF